MSRFNEDGNLLGRVGAVALLVAAGFGLHRLQCGSGSLCPVMKSGSCCSGAAQAAPEAAPAASPAPAK